MDSRSALPAVRALLMQIDANLINDLFDYRKGSDRKETASGPNEPARRAGFRRAP